MFSSPAFAQAAGAAPSAGGGLASLYQFTPFVLMGLIFYFLMIRPQQQRAKQHKAALEAMKKGDVVITSGGVVARVTRLDGEEVEVEIAPNVRIRLVRSTIATDDNTMAG